MMRTPILALVGAVALASAANAQATETIGLTGSNLVAASSTVAGPTISITLRGYTFSVPVATYGANPGAYVLTPQNVRRTGAGYGVAGDQESNQVDSNGVNELLEITFNTPGRYRIAGATFRLIDSNDTLAMFGVNGSTITRLGFTGDIDGNPALTGTIPATLVSSAGNVFTYTFGGNQSYARYLLGTTREEADGFALSSITVAAVPEPTTWAMMILGFGVIGGALRRRKRQTPALAAA